MGIELPLTALQIFPAKCNRSCAKYSNREKRREELCKKLNKILYTFFHFFFFTSRARK